MNCYNCRCKSPLGQLVLTADDIGLTGLWFNDRAFLEGRREAGTWLPEGQTTPIIDQARRWLEIYFSHTRPDFMPPLHLEGTPFQIEVWELLLKIPYGETVTYGRIAKEIAAARGIPRMSAQAVGGAVGRNNIPIIVPCHRVMGGDGSLTGYRGGLETKRRLLRLEGVLPKAA